MLATLAMICGQSMALAATTQAPTAATGDAKACVSLDFQYDDASREISALTVEGAGDDSAPREAVRQTKISNEISKANLIVNLMAARKCPLPKHAPGNDYSQAATNCAIKSAQQRLGGDSAGAACDRSTWQKDLGASLPSL